MTPGCIADHPYTPRQFRLVRWWDGNDGQSPLRLKTFLLHTEMQFIFSDVREDIPTVCPVTVRSPDRLPDKTVTTTPGIGVPYERTGNGAS